VVQAVFLSADQVKIKPAGIRHIRFDFMLDNSIRDYPIQVQAFGISLTVFQLHHMPERLFFVVVTAIIRYQGIQSDPTRVAKGRVTQIMGKAGSFYMDFVDSQRSCHCAANLGYFQRGG
jgi:hypothetical protein